MRTRTVFVVVLLCFAAQAGAAPRIAEIRFEGNEVTREETLLRELDFAVGESLDEQRIANSVQSVLDLGLFRAVDIRIEPDGDDVVVVVRVREKRFLLAIPRIDGSSDGGRSLGAQLRWDNVHGLNHSLSAFWQKGDRKDRIAADERVARVSYSAPYVWREHYGIEFVAEQVSRDALGPSGFFDERLDSVEFRMWRDVRYGRPRTGWQLGVGLAWSEQSASGPLAPPELGQATAMLFTADYSDLRFRVYSETGRWFRSRVTTAREGWLSDYSSTRAEFEHRAYIGLESGPHRNLNVIVAGGWANGGSDWRNTWSLGGSSRMRGYDVDWIEGNRFGYVAVEYLRPVHFNWLRLVAMVEAGTTGASVNNARGGGFNANVGLGLRVRLPWFINVELEAGVAYPLRGGDGLQVYAGRNR